MKKNCENCIHYEPLNELSGICQKAFQFNSIEQALEEDDTGVEMLGCIGIGIVNYQYYCKLHAVVAEKECHHF